MPVAAMPSLELGGASRPSRTYEIKLDTYHLHTVCIARFRCSVYDMNKYNGSQTDSMVRYARWCLMIWYSARGTGTNTS